MHHYASIINLCKEELAVFSNVKIIHVLREGNAVADLIAKAAGQSPNEFVVFNSMSSFLVDRVGITYPHRKGIK